MSDLANVTARVLHLADVAITVALLTGLTILFFGAIRRAVRR